MNQIADGAAPSDQALVSYTQWIYGLHALAVVLGLASSVALGFAGSLPSIIAVILNYTRRSEVKGTWLESHFRWQIRTFWFTWLWIVVVCVISVPLMAIVVGFITAIIGLSIIGIWIIYRVIRGWLALRERRPMPTPS
jgi:uncharacterized membrane protein